MAASTAAYLEENLAMHRRALKQFNALEKLPPCEPLAQAKRGTSLPHWLDDAAVMCNIGCGCHYDDAASLALLELPMYPKTHEQRVASVLREQLTLLGGTECNLQKVLGDLPVTRITPRAVFDLAAALTEESRAVELAAHEMDMANIVDPYALLAAEALATRRLFEWYGYGTAPVGLVAEMATLLRQHDLGNGRLRACTGLLQQCLADRPQAATLPELYATASGWRIRMLMMLQRVWRAQLALEAAV